MSSQSVDIQPSVIVLMPAYNHEKYIAQAIESVLNQITTFKVTLCISDDASSDSTYKIASLFGNKNKVVINLIRNEVNLGAVPNGAKLRNEAIKSQCKYISILESDDYWTDPLKLQKQVDYLEENLDVAISFTKTLVLKPDGELVDDYMTKVPSEISSLIDLVEVGNYIHTPTIVFRNLINEFPDFFLRAPIGDYPLYLLVAEFGKIKYFDNATAVYRIGSGYWSTTSSLKQQIGWINLLIELIEYFKLNSEVVLSLIVQYEKTCKSIIRMQTEEKTSVVTISKFIFLSYRYKRNAYFYYLKEVFARLRSNLFPEINIKQLYQIIFLRFQ